MLESIQITDDEMASLPEGAAGFIEFESICRAKLHSVLNETEEGRDTTDIRLSYITNVINAAHYFKVSDVRYVDFDPDESPNFAAIRAVSRKIDGEVSKMRFQAMAERRPVVVIEEPQRGKIEHLLKQLRTRALESELDEKKKTRLVKKIDEISTIFSGKSQPTLKDAMIVIASIFTAINQAEAAIIKLPDTISAIVEVFGLAQEDAQRKMIDYKVSQLRIEYQSDE